MTGPFICVRHELKFLSIDELRSLIKSNIDPILNLSNLPLKLSLGTATFGQSYGFFNKDNTLKSNECINILESAKEIGITSLDTAQSYGTSESILGSCPFLQSSFGVSSKVDTSNLCDIDIHSALLASSFLLSIDLASVH